MKFVSLFLLSACGLLGLCGDAQACGGGSGVGRVRTAVSGLTHRLFHRRASASFGVQYAATAYVAPTYAAPSYTVPIPGPTAPPPVEVVPKVEVPKKTVTTTTTVTRVTTCCCQPPALARVGPATAVVRYAVTAPVVAVPVVRNVIAPVPFTRSVTRTIQVGGATGGCPNGQCPASRPQSVFPLFR